MIDHNKVLKRAKNLIHGCTHLSFYKTVGGVIQIKCVVNRKTTMYSIGNDLSNLTNADLMRLVELANISANESKQESL